MAGSYVGKRRRGSSSSTRGFKKRRSMPRKFSQKRAFVRRVKSIIKSSAETKSRIDQLTTPLLGSQIFHNVTSKLADNLMLTAQSNDDFGREGDSVNPVGISLKFLVKQESDRPNVTFKYWVLRIAGSGTAPVFCPLKNVTGNVLLDSVDTEKAKVLRSGTFKYPDNYYINPGGNYDKELTYVRKLYIPFKGLSKYVYSGDNTLQGRDFNVALYVSAYDSFGTLPVDNICDCIVHKEFYFKDI